MTAWGTAHAFEPGLSLASRGLQIPGPERGFEPLSRKNALPFSPVPLAPPLVCNVLDLQFHGLTIAADAGGQFWAGPVRGRRDRACAYGRDAGARSRPARRRPELTAPVRAAASSSSAGRFCAVAQVGAARVQRQARRSAHGRRAGLLADGPAFCLAAGIGRVTLLIT